MICVPGGISCSVHYQTATLSLDSKSEFQTWFRMPLYKVDYLVERFSSFLPLLISGTIEEKNGVNDLGCSCSVGWYRSELSS